VLCKHCCARFHLFANFPGFRWDLIAVLCLVANVALFQENVLPDAEKNTWGGLLVAVVTIATLVTVGIAVVGKLESMQESIVSIPSDKVARLTPQQQALIYRMLYNFSLYQRLPADIPIKIAKQKLDPRTFNKLWRWRTLGKTAKSLPNELKMTVATTQSSQNSRDDFKIPNSNNDFRIPTIVEE
jgi:hypothetical protein